MIVDTGGKIIGAGHHEATDLSHVFCGVSLDPASQNPRSQFPQSAPPVRLLCKYTTMGNPTAEAPIDFGIYQGVFFKGGERALTTPVTPAPIEIGASAPAGPVLFEYPAINSTFYASLSIAPGGAIVEYRESHQDFGQTCQ
ncbi:MAG: hypothetical protein AB7P21_19095 [Lautropia sp.]